MFSPGGMIALMGSGELTATMVEVHKALLSQLGGGARGVFLDTPAGFQLNADQLSDKAAEYFRTRIQHPLKPVSFKSAESCTAFEAEQAYRVLRDSDFIMIGPGSPTYAVRQWLQTPIPDIFKDRIASGGCLVAASAAALTVGRFTVPVYEIYKVGAEIHWAEGLDVLGRFGLQLAVVPHWNNAEGGNHDTRFCYMGAPRFAALESMLPGEVSVLGLDEHTACIIDLGNSEFSIRGLGGVTLRRKGAQARFEKGEHYPLEILRGADSGAVWQPAAASPRQAVQDNRTPDDSFWNRVHEIQALFRKGMDGSAPEKIVGAILELDGAIWMAHEALESPEFISQAREILREMVAMVGARLAAAPGSAEECLDPLVKQVLALRERFRKEKKWPEADAVRDCLSGCGITIEDTREGSSWKTHTG